MKNKIVLILVVIVAAAGVMTGCSGYNKILKSTDSEARYRAALEYYQQGKYQRTIQLLEDMVHIFSGTDKRDSVAYYMAASFYKNGDFQTSGVLLDEFRKNIGKSPFLEDVEYMYAMGFYYQSPEPNRDQNTTTHAIVAMGEYLSRYPNSAKKENMERYMAEMVQKLHDRVFINAKSYYHVGRYKAAVMALKNALNAYPESSHREEIMYLTTKSSYLLASNSFEELMRTRYLDMMDSYYTFVSEFPDSDYLKELTKMQVKAKDYLAQFQDGEPIVATTQDPVVAPK